jgi:hypothetical protein
MLRCPDNFAPMHRVRKRIPVDDVVQHYNSFFGLGLGD